MRCSFLVQYSFRDSGFVFVVHVLFSSRLSRSASRRRRLFVDHDSDYPSAYFYIVVECEHMNARFG